MLSLFLMDGSRSTQAVRSLTGPRLSPVASGPAMLVLDATVAVAASRIQSRFDESRGDELVSALPSVITVTGAPYIAVMSATDAVTIIVSLSAFMLGTVLALVRYHSGRIDHLDARLTGAINRLELSVERLAEDVAVLRATSWGAHDR
jgi:uncharacterized membrane protein YoaK (UPF0700 family)